ncbi:chitodextrinase, partial [Ureibacillus xyleni]
MNTKSTANKSFIFILIFCMIFSIISGFPFQKVSASTNNSAFQVYSKTVNMGEEVSLFAEELGYKDYQFIYFDSTPGNGSHLGNGSATNHIQTGFSFPKETVDSGQIKFKSDVAGVYSFKVSWQSGQGLQGTKMAPYTEPITITILVVNGPPTDIKLINSNVPDGYSGVRVGYIESSDYYYDTNSYSIVNNPNDMFEISTIDSSKKLGMLRIKEGKTLAAGKKATVRVRATDSANNIFEKDVTVNGVIPKILKVAPGKSISWTYGGPDISNPKNILMPEKGKGFSIYEGIEYKWDEWGVYKDEILNYTAPNETGIDSFILDNEYYIVEIANQVDNAPSAGNNGNITTSNINTSGLTLSWTKATDDNTAPNDLEYQVYQSTTNNIDTVSNIESSGISPLFVSKGINIFNFTGLSPNTTYFFNILVKDAVGNKSVYQMKQVTTASLTNAAKPSIHTQPTDQTINVGDSATLNVTASGGVSLSYQWYSNTTNSTTGGKAITGATSPTYTAPTDTAGTTYYYVVITNTDNSATGQQTATATSSVAKVQVNTNAAKPSIHTQPTDQTINVGDSATLNVTASGGVSLSYQWYSNTTNSTIGGKAINGATSPTFTAPTGTAGTTYYYVVITNTDNSAN